jgi:nucleotidyltransferase substrate binding protein (TIGR01987 family)
LKHVLFEMEWVECNSPKSTIKEGFQDGYIENINIWFAMVESRNSTSHAYDEESAEILYQNILTYQSSFNEYHSSLSSKLFR